MSKLILSLEDGTLKEYRLDRERIRIGRKPGNDIQINDAAVSGEHALVITILNDSFLEDLASTNGTKVNGKPVEKCFLRHEDIIEIGKFKLTYVHEDAPAPDFEKTVMLRPLASPAMLPASASTPDVALQPQSPPAGQAMAAMRLLTGPSAGRELDLVKNLTTLGKPGVQVALITRRPQGFFVAHVDGDRSPVLNGQAIGFQSHPLQNHDILELVGIRMEFFLR